MQSFNCSKTAMPGDRMLGKHNPEWVGVRSGKNVAEDPAIPTPFLPFGAGFGPSLAMDDG